MVCAEVWMTGSGSPAMATRLTALAATAPPAMPANLKNSLLDVIACTCCSVGFGAAAGCRGGRRQGSVGGAADQGGLKCGVRQPKLLFCIDCRHHGIDLVACIGQQLEHANDHSVVSKLVFFRNQFAQWNDLVAVMSGNIKCGSVGRIVLSQIRSEEH